MTFNQTKFFDALKTVFPKPLKPSGIDGLGQLLAAVEFDSDVQDLRCVAYMLATIKHECANSWQPILERGGTSYFDKYNAGTPLGVRLGNTEPGDGFRFRGRGYVQITGRTNYAKLSTSLRLGRQLVDDPDLALRADIAYRIMSYGMRKGTFTGRKLDHYINSTKCDYLNARRIINGLDRAADIQNYASQLEEVLIAAADTAPAKPKPAAALPPIDMDIPKGLEALSL